MRRSTDQSQSILGSPPRTHNDHKLRLARLPRAFHLLCLPKYCSIHFRRSSWIHLSSGLYAEVFIYSCGLPDSCNPLSPSPGRYNLVTRFPLRLRVARLHRLYNLYPRQVLQAPACHVSSSYHIPQILSHIQILCRCPCDSRSRRFYRLPPIILLQEVVAEQQQLRLGAHAPRSEPSV